MDRRGFIASVPFLAALVALPTVEAARRRRFDTKWTGITCQGVDYYYASVDGTEPRTAVLDRYCPDNMVYGIDGVLIIPADLAKRLPKQDAVVERNGRRFCGWDLEPLLS